MKIFDIGDQGEEWVAAETLHEAKEFYKGHCDMGDEDVEGTREITEAELDHYRHLGDDCERAKMPRNRVPTFREELARMIADGHPFPCLFASANI